MQVRLEEVATVINVNYLLTLALVIYNVFVGIKSAPEKVTSSDDEFSIEDIYNLQDDTPETEEE